MNPRRPVHLLLVLMLTVLLPAQRGETPSTKEAARLRVLTYNIHHGAGLDGRVDLPRIAKVISGVRPDLVALQEVDKGVRRSDRADQPAVLAKLTERHATFERNITYQGGDFGNAVLSREAPTRTQNILLPQSRKDEQRGALGIEVPVGPADQKTTIRFLSTHFAAPAELEQERLDSVQLLSKLLTTDQTPTILAGDLNSLPTSAVLEGLLLTFALPEPGAMPTYPGRRPERQIDYILLYPKNRWRCVEIKVLDDGGASDHRPLFAELVLLEPPQ